MIQLVVTGWIQESHCSAAAADQEMVTETDWLSILCVRDIGLNVGCFFEVAHRMWASLMPLSQLTLNGSNSVRKRSHRPTWWLTSVPHSEKEEPGSL